MQQNVIYLGKEENLTRNIHHNNRISHWRQFWRISVIYQFPFFHANAQVETKIKFLHCIWLKVLMIYLKHVQYLIIQFDTCK